ncbi:MAG TPA: signal peptide peptidase SppA [Candidatus Cloacimonadota bacterium]|nr:signal peptide peptidase SppA [Candidatus Cloacimonadota bacterium]
MKSKWFALGCLTSFLIIVLVVYLLFSGLSKMTKDFSGVQYAKVNEGSFLHIDITGQITSYNEYSDNLFTEPEVSAQELINKIDYAATDEKISGILLEPHTILSGYADLNEIMAALERFRATDKKVYSYLDMATNKDYFLASASDQIVLNPSASAGILLTGVGGNVLFYKELLDKIGIDVTVLTAGKYKGAGENFTSTSFSQPVRQNLQQLYGSIYDTILEKIARNRNLNADEIRYIYESRPEMFINQDTAVEYKLVDELMQREDLIARYQLKNHLVDYKKYRADSHPVSAYKIAVIYAQGNIAPSSNLPTASGISAEKINPILDDLMRDNSVKAIVLRVNSPGGSALISEIITAKIDAVRQHKPVVVSMGNLAASGGYYISSNADYIVADPFVITGSIGVVSMIPTVGELTDKLGVTHETIGKGKYATSFDLYSKLSAEEIKTFQASIDKTYLEFKERVARGRSLSLDTVEKFAQGQVWNSYKAVEYGLADEVGMLNDAIRKAAELAGVTNYQVTYFPKQKSQLEEILKKGFNLDLSAKLLGKGLPKELELDETYQLYQAIKSDPVQTILPYKTVL